MTTPRPLLARLLLPALLVAAPLAALAQAPAAAPAPVTSVAAVDLARYSGKWFEIAAFPMFFQRNCLGDTTAEYSARDDGAITVHNRCRTDSGFDDATGKATVVEGFANSRLKVSFFWPFKADYWVLGLDPEYRWAVVGNPNRKYLWVLSRTPQLPAPLLEAALASASAQGFDLSQLHYTPQTQAPQAKP
jgi:apolipoprotein D and lipocalin family protein